MWCAQVVPIHVLSYIALPGVGLSGGVLLILQKSRFPQATSNPTVSTQSQTAERCRKEARLFSSSFLCSAIAVPKSGQYDARKAAWATGCVEQKERFEMSECF